MYNYNSVEETFDDTIDIDFKSRIDHYLSTMTKNWFTLLLVVVLVTEAVLSLSAVIYTPQYTGSVSYVVNKTNDDGSDVNMAIALGIGMIEGFDSSGLHRMIDEQFVEKPEWLDVKMIEPAADQVTNILIITVKTDNYYHSVDLLNVLKRVMPEYAGLMQGTIRLTVLDEREVQMEPENSYNFYLMAALGVVLGIVVALMVALVKTMRHQTIRREEDIRSITNLECIEQLPNVPIRSTKKNDGVINSLIGNAKQEPFNESIRSVRHKVERLMGETESKVLMVASSSSGEGKSTVCVNLAISLAQAGKKVLLIDADVRNPNVARILKISEVPGTLGGYLMGKVGKDKLITRLQNPKLDVILGMPGENVDSARLRSRRMSDMIMALRQYYDYILLDSAPLTVVSDGSALGQYSDASLFVVRYDYAKKKNIEEGLRTLNSCKVPCIGYVLNGMEHLIRTSDKYSYKNYGYRYGKK